MTIQIIITVRIQTEGNVYMNTHFDITASLQYIISQLLVILCSFKTVHNCFINNQLLSFNFIYVT